MWIRLSRYHIINNVFSQTAEYALRAIVTMAQNESIANTAQEIARQSQVPPDYLSKVMNLLARGGVVHAQRGRGGGFTLAMPAAQMTVLDVVNAVDPIRRIRSCPLHLRAHVVKMCLLHRKLDHALALVEDAFRSTPIASLCDESGNGGHPLCDEISRPETYVAIRSR
jgi:Rrf2 family nitric oxide-sensitive transcriptional repressor